MVGTALVPDADFAPNRKRDGCNDYDSDEAVQKDFEGLFHSISRR